MKILIVINDIDFFISHRLLIALELCSKGHEVHIAADRIPDQEISKIVFHYFQILRASKGGLNNFRSMIQLQKIIKEVSPDIVHNVTLKPIVFSSLLLIFNTKIKVVNAVSGLGFLYTNNRFSASRALIETLLRVIINLKAPFFIFQNKEDLREFKKLGLKKEYSIIKGSGVNQKEFPYTRAKQQEKLNITFTGRILKDKGILELIEAVNLLPEQTKSKVILNIYGKIDVENPAYISEDELSKFLKPEFIIWHGFTRDIKKVLTDVDIYCLPSYREGLPKSTIEAMAFGRPILTTNAPGCDDTVKEGVNGFKVDIGNAHELSKKLQFLIEDEELRIKMGKNSRILFEKKFTLEKVIKQTFEVYDTVLQN